MAITNSDRAEWARIAIDAFRGACATDHEDAPGDLVTDILHLVRREYGVADLRAWLDARLNMHDLETAEDPEDDEDEDWSCDSCGETAQDGSGECVTCGQPDGEG